jgi:hypothetical protein
MPRSFGPLLWFLVLALSSLYPQTCLACRYNVRETGFVDLGVERYFLFCYVGRDTPSDLLSVIEETAEAAFRDSPVVLQVVPADAQKDHPALKYRESAKGTPFPSFVLVSPTERSRPIPVQGSDNTFRQALDTACRRIASSAVRETLVQRVARHYAVVLLIEGPNETANARARKAAEAAIETINRQMAFMPKPVTRGPVLLTLKPDSFSTERILLWSLGVLDEEVLAQPHAAVIYGKARRIGPLLKGDQITQQTLENILFIVGADCECGLDPRLYSGIGLPVKWNKETRAFVAADLGFDPDNPMVMIEVSQIMKIRAAMYPWSPRERPSAAADDLPVPFVEDNKPAGTRAAAANPWLTSVVYILSGVAGLVVVVTLWMVLRARRRDSCI